MADLILSFGCIFILILISAILGYSVEYLRYVKRFRKVHGKNVWKRAFQYIRRG